METFQWKCLICSIEAPGQVGLEMQHISDGVIHTDGIDQKKWVCCNKCKKTFHLYCVTQEKEENTNSPSCAGSMSVGSNPKFKRVGLGLKQVIKRVTFLFLVARQKTTQKKIRRAKDGRIITPARKQVLERALRNSNGRWRS